MVWHKELMADVIVQAAGLAASVVGVVALVQVTITSADEMSTVAVATYGITLIAMFVSSLLNALFRHPVVRLVDHSVIYLLIAGTYTPFCLLVIGGDRGMTLLIGVWIAALLGVTLRIILNQRLKSAVITLYVLLGWCGVIHLDVIYRRLTVTALILMGVGGLIYTMGAPLHRLYKLRYHSALWHGCVVAAAGCHYAAIMLILYSFHGQSVA